MRKLTIIAIAVSMILILSCESPTEPGTLGEVELYRDPDFEPPTALIGISGDFDMNLLVHARNVEIINDGLVGDGEGYYYAFFVKFNFYDEPGYLTELHVYDNGVIDYVYLSGFGRLVGLIDEVYITLRSDADSGDGTVIFNGTEWEHGGLVMNLNWVYDPADDAYGGFTAYDDGTYDVWFENLGETPDGMVFALWHKGVGTVAAEAETILLGEGETNAKGGLFLSGELPRAFRADDELSLTLETKPDAVKGPSPYRILFGKAGDG
jgi:hypothetical protein